MAKININREPNKLRNYEFTSYVDPSRFVDLLRGARHYAWIRHDNPEDLKRTDGTCKEPHYHVVVAYENPRYESAMFKRAREWTERNGTTLRVEAKHNLRSALLYLTHDSEKAIANGKVKYDIKNVSCDDFAWFNNIIDNGEVGSFSSSNFLRDLLTLTMFECAIIYGRDYMRNYRAYRDFITTCLDDAGGDVDALLDVLQNEREVGLLDFATDKVLEV